MACTTKVLKKCLTIFQFLYGVVGVVFIFLVLSAKTVSEASWTEEIIVYGAISLIGIIMLAISVIGFIGVTKRNSCLLKTFAITIYMFSAMLGILAFLALLTSAVMNNPKHEKEIAFVMNTTIFDNMYLTDKVQTSLHCCGIHGPQFFKIDEVPLSCCKNADHICTQSSEDLYRDGCFLPLKTLTEKTLWISASLYTVVALFGFIQGIMALIVTRSVQNKLLNYKLLLQE